MHKSRLLAMLVAGAATVLVSSASVATGAAAEESKEESASVQAYGQCTGSWVRTTAVVVVRAEPRASSANMATTISGELRACRKLVLGDRYDACGVYNANGWVMVQIMDLDPNYPRGWSGFIPSTCTVDYS